MGNTFAEVLASAMASQSLTLERISAKLRQAGAPVSVTTLSSWKSGKSLPSRHRSMVCLRELDRLLQLPEGTLRAAAAGDSTWELDVVVPAWETAQALAEELGIDLERKWTKLYIKDRLFVDAAGHDRVQTVTCLLRAEEDQASSWAFFLGQDTEIEGACGDVVARTGLELDVVRHVPEQHLTVGAFAMPRPIPLGGVTNVEFDIVWGPQSRRSRNMRRATPDPIEALILEVVFEGPMPRRFERVYQSNKLDEVAHFDDVAVHGNLASIALQHPPTGTYGITWEW